MDFIFKIDRHVFIEVGYAVNNMAYSFDAYLPGIRII